MKRIFGILRGLNPSTPPHRPATLGPANSTQDVTRRSDTLPDAGKIQKVRKPRSDSTLDSRLSPHEADELAGRLDHGLSLREAAEHLHAQFGISLSRVSISRWAARRRRAKTELTFASLMHMVDNDRARAARLNPETDRPESLHQANELFVSQALFVAQINHDPDALRQASRLFADVMGALAQSRRADAQRNLVEARLRNLARAAAV